MNFALSSTAFQNGEPIPSRYTGDGPDASPPLAWSDVPEGTKAFTLICDDPDAPGGTWVHWVLYDIPAETASLEEGVARKDVVLGSGRQGRTDFKRNQYNGPAPPPGKPHRYFFKLYALDQATGLAPGQRKEAVLAAIKGHVLGEAELMGTYQR